MNRTIAIAIVALFLGIAVLANAEEKVIEKKIEAPTLKERVEGLQKRISRMETELNAQIDLSREAIASAKKQIEEAIKNVDNKDKELDVEAALYKANHYLHSVAGFGGMGGMHDDNVKIVKMRKMMGMPGSQMMEFGDNDDMPGMDGEKEYNIEVNPKDFDMRSDGDSDNGKVRVKVLAK